MKNQIKFLILLLLPLTSMGQLKQFIIVQNGDTLKFPIYVSTTQQQIFNKSYSTGGQNNSSYISLVGCQPPNDYEGYCDSLKKAVRINFTDTITYKTDGEHLEVTPIIDYTGKVVRILISFNDISRFRNTYKVAKFIQSENKEIYIYEDTLIYKETIDALNKGHIDWLLPANTKEGQYYEACNVTIYYPTKRRMYGGGWWAIPANGGKN